jgi:uncharacterized protein YoxC
MMDLLFVFGLATVVLLCLVIYLLVCILRSVQKGLNETIKGLSVIHEQLIDIRKNLSAESGGE